MDTVGQLLNSTAAVDMTQRLRRNRKSCAIRSLLQETRLHSSQLVAPLFIVEGSGEKQAIASMPDVFRLSQDLLIKEVAELYDLGIRAVDLFAYVPAEKKDWRGSEAVRSGNLIQRCIRAIKEAVPEICVMADIALDPYTDHGHDGIIDSCSGQVDNDATLEVLAEMSLCAAAAGVDVVAPSDMMDGRVSFIRRTLDREGYTDVSILSYAVKYVSAFYAPFRSALNSAPSVGDKCGYQLNCANSREALREAAADVAEGADMLLVKPALPYLDIISKVKEKTLIPVGAYHVSGEYAMLAAAAQRGWLEYDSILTESLISIRRAGADFILTYGAKRMAHLLRASER